MATIADRIKSARSNTNALGSTGSSRVVELLRPRLSPIVEQRKLDDERKKKEEQIKKSQEEAQRYANESGTGALIGNTLKGIRPWTREGLSNIGQGIVNVGKAIVNPIDTAKKVGGVVKDLATSSAQDTAYDLFYQKGLDKQNLQTIQDNNKKVLELNEAIKATQNESEKEKLKRHAKIYLEFNQRLADETGGELKDKTNLQLAGQALGTAMDLTPFLGFGSLGAKVGLKTLGAAGVKSATKELAKKTGGKIFGKALPQTGKELTKEAVIEGGLYGGLSGFGAGIEQKDPTLKSVGISTALGTGLGVVAGGILSKVLSRLGAKAPRLEKKIESGEVTEKEIEDIFNDSGIDGVEEIIKPEPVKLKAGEFAPIAKEIQETTGKKLTAKETLEVKDKIEQGYTKEEIIDEITTPKRTELTSKTLKEEKTIQIPKETSTQSASVYKDAKELAETLTKKETFNKGETVTVEYTPAGYQGSTTITGKVRGYTPGKMKMGERKVGGGDWEKTYKGADGDIFIENADGTATQIRTHEINSFSKEAPKSPSPIQTVKATPEIKAPKTTKPKTGESITAKKLNETMPDEYKINEYYDKITLKGELDRAGKEIAKDQDEALRKAFSREERVDRRIAKLEEFSQIAKENKDYEAVNRLFTQANKIGTETAQGLNMLKALYAVNPEYKYMQDVINARLGKIKVGVKDIEKSTKEVREMIAKKGKDLKEKTKQAFKVQDAQELLNKIMCK